MELLIELGLFLLSLLVALLILQILGLALRSLCRGVVLLREPPTGEPLVPHHRRNLALRGMVRPVDPVKPPAEGFVPCLWYRIRWKDESSGRRRSVTRSDRTCFHLHLDDGPRLLIRTEGADFEGVSEKLPAVSGRLQYFPVCREVTVVGELDVRAPQNELGNGLLCGMFITYRPPGQAAIYQLIMALLLSVTAVALSFLVGLFWTL